MKKIVVIANGYSEEMMATNLISELQNELTIKNISNQYQIIAGSLVSSSKNFESKGIKTFFVGGMTPSGGFPTKSIKGFLADFFAGAFFTPFNLLVLFLINLHKIYIIKNFKEVRKYGKSNV